MKDQQGMVLFFSLIILLIMTVVGVAIAMSSTQSLRMSQAGADRVKASVAVQGALNAVVLDNQGSVLANLYDSLVINDPDYQATSTLIPLNEGDVPCARSTRPTAGVACRKVEVTSQVSFGRDNAAQLSFVTGLEQEVLAD
ncbi:pilus assembly PilX family protein [Shewanella surugensis]|uniref:Pilus assembly PilX N-terminal domain-containing protein n=1 Tax=Shewanella surugensis TaxID=212020 RepID=A0ABT0L5V5_9GAMM|nr:pilus assembly PilX N-terminal domain-containing protein [Shewanella surugensis]MCL1123050.1 pilus assembly PilX N-terminal domain-containing protein [Shewanella surugensis]